MKTSEYQTSKITRHAVILHWRWFETKIITSQSKWMNGRINDFVYKVNQASRVGGWRLPSRIELKRARDSGVPGFGPHIFVCEIRQSFVPLYYGGVNMSNGKLTQMCEAYPEKLSSKDSYTVYVRLVQTPFRIIPDDFSDDDSDEE